jgi:hypothetical protein
MSRTVYVNGSFVPEADAKISVFDRAFLFAEGVYEVTAVLGGKPLDPTQIAIIRNWIDHGAEWPEASHIQATSTKHWAFIPPARATLPKVANPSWVRNPIDRFILAKLDSEKLQPGPEANRTTLLRRLSLDLIGLPPTPEEIDSFLNDKNPNAYQKQVDRLLQSPHYGERWARTWLDAARYADSDGFEKDKQRSVWFYRDWVINALNRDLPYNEFIIDQIAGDLLPTPQEAVRREYSCAAGRVERHDVVRRCGFMADVRAIEIENRIDQLRPRS